MTPKLIREQLRLIRKQVEKIGRVDHRYRRNVLAALGRLCRLEADMRAAYRQKPGPKPGGKP
jgi:hypothetical protein